MKTCERHTHTTALIWIGVPILTELNEVVDREQDLHLSRERLDGRGSVVLVDSGEGLGAEVAALEERADKHLTDITSQLRERAVTCANTKTA